MTHADAQYVKDNAYRAQKSRDKSAEGRDIGEIPPCGDTVRREGASRDFQSFCETYHPELFSREWSADHLKAISRIESAVLHGGQFAFAMPRGSGKTTLSYVACEWALLYGHRSFVVLIGSEATAARELLDALRTDLENNEMLLEDFPEVVYPIQKLEGIAHRCNGQTYNGERTQMTWTGDQVVLPTVKGSAASGAAIRVAGLTGRLRGMQSKTPDGKSIRPDIVIVDDPQTDDSARSVSQNDHRERLLAGAVLGLAGPGETIAALMPCTVIRHGDMADRLLNRDRHPEWRGERTKLVYEWPSNHKLWDEYADIWSTDLKNGGDGSASTEFYRSNREAMDAGHKAAWPARFEKSELSAIQHAFNLKLRVGEDAFNAEYQNQPTDVDSSLKPITLTSDDITSKVSKVAKRVVPAEFTRVTAFVDLSQKCLWWCMCAFNDSFGGQVIDYGIFPDQHTRYSKLSTVQKTLQKRYAGHGVEAAISRGLEDLVASLMQPLEGETGSEFCVEKILIDEGDGEHTQIVRNFCRRSEVSAIVGPAKGRGIKASSTPLCEGRPKSGERFGSHWKLVKNKDRGRTTQSDVNYWKTFCMRRFEVAAGDPGALSLFKATPRQHQMFADQLTAEIPKEMEDVGTGNRVIEWSNPRQKDNHFFDCLVGCFVGASQLGCTLTAQRPVEVPKTKRRNVSYL